MALLGALVPVGIVISIVLIGIAAIGSSRTTEIGSAQRAAALARRRARRDGQD